MPCNERQRLVRAFFALRPHERVGRADALFAHERTCASCLADEIETRNRVEWHRRHFPERRDILDIAAGFLDRIPADYLVGALFGAYYVTLLALGRFAWVLLYFPIDPAPALSVLLAVLVFGLAGATAGVTWTFVWRVLGRLRLGRFVGAIYGSAAFAAVLYALDGPLGHPLGLEWRNATPGIIIAAMFPGILLGLLAARD